MAPPITRVLMTMKIVWPITIVWPGEWTLRILVVEDTPYHVA